MKHRSTILALAAAIAATTLTAPASAAPRSINHEGFYSDGDGFGVDGEHDFVFRLYTQAADGVAVWSEDHRLLLVGGYYFVELGRRSPVAGALADADQAWLGISIDGAEEASPRHPLGSVPFALVADTVDGLDSTKFMRVDRDTGTTGTIRTTGMDINPHEIAGGNQIGRAHV